jgi:hypothetical protein
MAYIGHTPAEKYVSLSAQHFTVTATANYTLSNSVTNENEIALFINNVRQQPGGSYAYTAAGTTLTLSAATAGTDTMYCVYLGKAVGTINPPDGSVNSATIADGSITDGDLAGSISSAKITSLDAAKLTGTVADARISTLTASKLSGVVPAANLGTGTASSTTVLYGDGTYKAEPVTANEITKQSGAPTISNPATPTVGDLILATSTQQLYICQTVSVGANVWANIGDGSGGVAPFMSASGGTETTDGNYKIHTFTTSGTLTVNSPTTATDKCQYLVIAGGGSGAWRSSAGGDAGGGAGGYRTATDLSVTVASYTITVGAGSAGPNSGSTRTGEKGSNSTFSSITSTGGGGGGCDGSGSAGFTGGTGGSGGGSNYSSPSTSGAGNEGGFSPVEGYRGGYGYNAGGSISGGGGGGSSAVGGNHVSGCSGGVGGAGTASTITGSSVTRAGGGGGGGDNRCSGVGGSGGSGGGGNGCSNTGTATSGTTNTGSGGGCIGSGGSGTTNGGSGVVVIRYKFQ